MTVLATVIAGFIATEVTRQLLGAGHEVVGVDNLNDYYGVRLTDYRLSHLVGQLRPGYGVVLNHDHEGHLARENVIFSPLTNQFLINPLVA